MLRREVKQQLDNFVVDRTKPLGAAAAVTVFQQLGLRLCISLSKFNLEQHRHGGASSVLTSGMDLRQFFDLCGDPHDIEERRSGGLWIGLAVRLALGLAIAGDIHT